MIDRDKELYRIMIPQSLTKYLKNYGGQMLLEGTFYQSEYDYLAIGNRTIMAIMKSCLKPVCSIVTHPTLDGILFIYKISAFDGRHQQSDGSIIGIFYDGSRSEILDMNELWNFGTKSKLDQHSVDLIFVEDALRQAKSKLETVESNFRDKVTASLRPFIHKIKDATTSYYLSKTNKLELELDEAEAVKNESPSASRRYIDLRHELEALGKQFTRALKKVEKDMEIRIVTELVGISLVVPQVSDTQIDSAHEQTRPYFIPKLSELTKFHNQINKELSTTTHERFVKNPKEWFEYHRLLEEEQKNWKVHPNDEIIERLRGFPQWWKIGDFGCGKAKIRDTLGERVFSFDHVAINKNFISCDMKDTQLPNNSLEVIVFCQSLMSANWEDYIKEARRCLVINGTLLIAETTHSLSARLTDLKDMLRKNSFQIYLEYVKDRFTFIEATKREFKTTYL